MTAQISAINKYASALNSADKEAFLAAFAADAVMIDPYGGRELNGHEGLGKFFKGFSRTWASFTMTTGEPFVAGDRVAFTWTINATSHTEKEATFSGINVFTVNEEGLINRMEGYWDFKAMVAQIS